MRQRHTSLSGLRVLVIDDEQRLVRGLQRNLARSGASVTVASSVADALLALDHKNEWDLALVDQMLPDGDGLELICRIERQKNPPAVIAVSGNLQSSKRCLRLQAHGAVLLPKPFDADDLCMAMSRALSSARRARAESAHSAEKHLRYSSIALDLVTQVATVDGTIVDLQPAQIRILAHLLTYPGRSFGSDELTKTALRGTHDNKGGNIRFQIHSLRRRLGKAGRLIETRNRGYGVGLWP